MPSKYIFKSHVLSFVRYIIWTTRNLLSSHRGQLNEKKFIRDGNSHKAYLKCNQRDYSPEKLEAHCRRQYELGVQKRTKSEETKRCFTRLDGCQWSTYYSEKVPPTLPTLLSLRTRQPSSHPFPQKWKRGEWAKLFSNAHYLLLS